MQDDKASDEWERSQRGKPAACEGANVAPDWQTCQDIADIEKVDEALRAFSADPTGDAGVLVVQAVLAEAREALAGRLIDAWVESHGRRCPWAIAIEICAVVTKMPDAERQRLLSLD